jgi:hypothetical protein
MTLLKGYLKAKAYARHCRMETLDRSEERWKTVSWFGAFVMSLSVPCYLSAPLLFKSFGGTTVTDMLVRCLPGACVVVGLLIWVSLRRRSQVFSLAHRLKAELSEPVALATEPTTVPKGGGAAKGRLPAQRQQQTMPRKES